MARGLGSHVGSFDKSGAMQDIIDGDCFTAVPSSLTGTADAIPQSTGGNFIITTGSADAITLPLPLTGSDDNLTIAFVSATNFAHSVTLPSAKMAPGVALKTTATLAAFAGAGISLRAWNGTWQVIGSQGTVTYS